MFTSSTSCSELPTDVLFFFFLKHNLPEVKASKSVDLQAWVRADIFQGENKTRFFSLCSYVVNKMFAEKTHTQVFMFERNVAVLKHTHACVQKNPVRCCVLIVCQTFGACTLRHCLIGRSKVQWAPTRLGLSAHLGSVGQEAGHQQECVRPGSTMSKSALSASLSSGSSAAVARLAQPQSAPFKKKTLL